MSHIIASPKLIRTIMATVELCGRPMTDAAAEIFVEDVSGYPEDQVLGALARCRREVKGVLTPKDVIDRLEDGRPSPDEAWALVPKNEFDSAVWTEEMAHAWSIASTAWMDGDRAGAARAFREAYIKAVSHNRDRRIQPAWSVTQGDDRQHAYRVVEAAVRNKLIGIEMATDIAPDLGSINTCDVLRAIAAPKKTKTEQIEAAKKVEAIAMSAVKGATK